MTDLRQLVVCSLEPWDEVWRRNQFLVEGLLRRNPRLRVLFVEPPGSGHGLRRVSDRLWAFRPRKLVPRRFEDGSLRRQALRAARSIALDAPVLWVNDVTYAPLAAEAGWPMLYDVTDDWLLAPAPGRELARLRRLDERALADAAEVVVCSPGLAESRGRSRRVTLVPNGVETARFRTPQPRPPDLPTSPAAVYVGTLHGERIDVELVVELASALPELTVALVGPDSLTPTERDRLGASANVRVLGARPYETVPGYLQHADVVVVPHRVTPFTDSLDPIKAYECLAVGVPTVATEVAGFRGLNGSVRAVSRDEFVASVESALRGPRPPDAPPADEIDWENRCAEFEAALLRTARALRTARREEGLLGSVYHDVCRHLERPAGAADVVLHLLWSRGVQAVALYRIAHWCHRRRLRPLSELLLRVSQLVWSVDIDFRAQIGPGLVLRHPMGIVVGRDVRIGRNVTMFHGVTLGIRGSAPDGQPTIGELVLLGAGAAVLGPVEVGAESAVGANAVVTASIPPRSVAVGNPARVVSVDGQRR